MHGFVQSLIWPARAYLCVVNGGTRQGLGVHQILFITAADLCVHHQLSCAIAGWPAADGGVTARPYPAHYVLATLLRWHLRAIMAHCAVTARRSLARNVAGASSNSAFVGTERLVGMTGCHC